MRYAYYPGCSLHASAKEYDSSWRAVCDQLDIELDDLSDWNCCGTVHASSIDRALAIAFAARNLAIAEDMGAELVVPCSGCYKNLRTAEEALGADSALRARINMSLGARSFDGRISVKHPLYIITEDIGLERFKDAPRPLHGIKIAPYYGCVITRPPAPQPIDDPEEPQALDRLLEALGADVVPYPAKTKCCGGAVLVSHTDVSIELTGRVLSEAKKADADCVVVACPMCQMALDGYQPQIEKRLGESLNLPILYFTQVLGLAMGIDERQLGLGRLLVSPSRVVARV